MFVLVCIVAQGISFCVFQIDNSVGSLYWSFLGYVGLLFEKDITNCRTNNDIMHKFSRLLYVPNQLS